MAARTKTYPIVENAINLSGDWLKHRQEMRELRDMNGGDLARIAQDLSRTQPVLQRDMVRVCVSCQQKARRNSDLDAGTLA